MILADTSVWIGMFRSGDGALQGLLDEGQIVTHQFVLGELACGSLRGRAGTLRLLKQLPALAPARHEEVMDFLEMNRLRNFGLGWTDMHLLAAARLGGCGLYTRDRRLAEAAKNLHLGM